MSLGTVRSLLATSRGILTASTIPTKTAALLGGLLMGCSLSFTLPPSGEGGYCNNAWDGVPCQTGLVCNTYNICQPPVPAGGECIGDVCAPELACVLDDPPSTTASGVCLPCAWVGTCNDP